MTYTPLPESLKAKVRAWQRVQDQNARPKPCRLALNLKNESVYCESRDQWISERVCLFCSNYEPWDGEVPSQPTQNNVPIVGIG